MQPTTQGTAPGATPGTDPGATPTPPPASATPAAPVTPPATEPPIDPHAHRNALEELERLRKFKANAEKAAADAEKAKLSELERAQHDAQEAAKAQADTEQKYKALLIRSSVERQAAQVGIDPDLAVKLVDAADLEFADDGAPKNVEKLLKDLLAKHPNLAVTTPKAAPSTTPPLSPARSALLQQSDPAARAGKPLSLTDAWRQHDQSKQRQ